MFMPHVCLWAWAKGDAQVHEDEAGQKLPLFYQGGHNLAEFMKQRQLELGVLEHSQ